MDFNGPSTTVMGTEEVDSYYNIWDSLLLAYDQWVALPISGQRPSARYKHAAAVAQEKLYVTGGSRNGRYLSDIQVLDLRTLTWSMVKPHPDPNLDLKGDSNSQEILPASASHSLVKWGNKLLVVAGHSKEPSDTVTVRSIDIETHRCCVEKTSGEVPVARGGQSVTLVGSRLIMFGGEGISRKLLNDLHILDLETMRWDIVQTTQTPPAPRFDHTTAIHAERYLLIFGGGSHSTCFSDLHVLDLETMEWSQPQIQGEEVTARAGHAGATIDENWYIVGGGDNKSGASETLALNMPKLIWSVVTSIKGRDPLASEVFVLKPKPRDSSKPKLFQSPAAAAAAASVKAAYVLTTMTTNKPYVMNADDVTSREIITGTSPQDFTSDINAITTEKKTVESALTEIRLDNSRLKGDLDEMNNTHAELSKELHSVQAQLADERSRCLKLEVQITELRKSLESLQTVEHELQVLQVQKSASEQDMELAAEEQGQRSGGVWKWIAG
ncbi:acyl-CoA-binding domain-containing protein 6 isoform X2 [Magnolia sinica]|uniref:acyl-CoA-binding domain-containing protein 6 isoform X2 n=1 Tax=Magnolia sinica TaxID=86752 RepID=UPI00265ACBEB|nr:acyl-CoA-binding domain-containing protein 6 isoform X2 [Magnolia sinica]